MRSFDPLSQDGSSRSFIWLSSVSRNVQSAVSSSVPTSAIAQPLLLFTLSLPLHALLILPPSELSSGPLRASIRYSAILPFLPARFHTAPTTTPILHLGDLALVLLALGILGIEATADRQMYTFQSSKHASTSPKITSKHSRQYLLQGGPKATPFPKTHYPGFITSGLFRWTRHPNFAAEQLFWLTEALFVVVAGESSRVTRSGWIGGSVFGPCFAVSSGPLTMIMRLMRLIAELALLCEYIPHRVDNKAKGTHLGPYCSTLS